MKLEKAIEHAAEHLPEGWTVHIAVEKGAGWVRAERPDGSMVEMHEDETDFEEQVRNAVRLAHDEIAADALSQHNDTDHPRRDGAGIQTEAQSASDASDCSGLVD